MSPIVLNRKEFMKIKLIQFIVIVSGLSGAANFITGCERGTAQSVTAPPA